MALLAHVDGLNPPTSKLDAVAAFIFLLLLASSNCFVADAEGLENIDEDLIKALFSTWFLWNLEENFIRDAVAVSSSDGGRSRMPIPIFLEAASSSATLFF